ncbi:hypothetical protein APUTEX25_004931 [Auxenochlorella protothecoides]|uniref:PX domain-containing protein n=1 Tax=Auxenochlorella protothecoides TaxID=3075 RepID=A0A3M7KSE5_AUXPR|nr:hypothetical protein APUTEX25_004931 [Auxenochlorella protothecoides]|eukprot:RMZ53443.1 hypothetical protein APUTEX25_004931 [Auxenochlorella protothecoides]
MGTDLHAGRADHSVDPLSHGEARGSLDDPPPYESIIMGTARPLEAAITVFVTDPVRQLEGVRSFVSYRVTYRPASGPGSSVHPAGVIRRFSDFDWLKKQLRANHRGCIVPPLPEKNSCAPRELAALSERSEAAACAAHGLAIRLAREVEAPLKEAARALLAVQRATADRSAALGALSSARADVDAQRSRLARLRGIREERVAEAERDLAHAQRKADAAKEVYNAIATRMSSELVAFQRQRAEELSAVLRRFATLVAAGEGAAAKTWAPLARGADA